MSMIKLEHFNEKVSDQYNELLTHNFLKRFEAGILSRDQIKLWAVEQAWLARSFAANFEAVSMRLPYSGSHDTYKSKLAKVIEAESYHSTKDSGHPNFCKQMFEVIAPDVSLDEELVECLETTKQYVDGRQDILVDQRHSIFYALGALAIHEFLNADTNNKSSLKLGIMVSVMKGLKKEFPDNIIAAAYASRHVHDEESDYALLKDIKTTLMDDIQKNPELINIYPHSFNNISDPRCDPEEGWNKGAMAYLELRKIHLDGLEATI